MLERAEAIQDELDQLVAQLAAAFGLGGRDRARRLRPAERARLNVTRAVRAAIAKLAEALPEAGAALDRHVRTGLYCAYAAGRRRPALDRSVLIERIGAAIERLQGMFTPINHHRRDQRRHLPHLHLDPRRDAGRLHVQPVPGDGRRAAPLPHRRPAACSRWSPRRWPRSYRSNRCAGSRSATSSPTSAGR